MAVIPQSSNRISNEMETANKLIHEAIDNLFTQVSECPVHANMTDIRVSVAHQHSEPIAAHASCKLTVRVCGHSRPTERA